MNDELERAQARIAELEGPVRALYYAARWSADRPVDEAKLWTDVRDAFGFPPGESPKALNPTPPPSGKAEEDDDCGGGTLAESHAKTLKYAAWLNAQLESKPPEPEDLPHPGTGRLLSASPVKPPEPEPYRRTPEEAERDIAELRVHLAAAQEEVRQWKLHADWGKTYWDALKDCDRQLQAATERAEKLQSDFTRLQGRYEDASKSANRYAAECFELRRERDAAIKAKEEARRARGVGEVLVLIEERDAAIKAKEEAEEGSRLALAIVDEQKRSWQSDIDRAEAAEVTAGELRAALENLRAAQRAYMADRGNHALGHKVAEAAIAADQALAAHSKAVGP